jgi:hypothetical protein
VSRVTPQIWQVAGRLLAYETRENLTQAIRMPAVFLVCEKLRAPLATLMGRAGFRALLARALTLAGLEASWPGMVQVKEDGTLAGLDKLEGQIARKEFAEASVVLIARLVGLLVAFIGEELTFRLLREIWPEVRFNDDILITRENNE